MNAHSGLPDQMKGVFPRLLILFLCLGLAAGKQIFASPHSGVEKPDKENVVLLTDPFLQHPSEDGVHVVWFTEWQGRQHLVHYGQNLDMQVKASSRMLSRMAEDADSRIGQSREIKTGDNSVSPREIWRHEAYIQDLRQGERVRYYVKSVDQRGTEVKSRVFSLQPSPKPGQPLKILLTSDHQSKPMTAANLEMVEKTVGVVDAVFFAGDLVNTPDRASEWFDDERGSAFFPCLQGKGSITLKSTFEKDRENHHAQSVYRGGAIIQHAPLFPVVGNHEVMGRYDPGRKLEKQIKDPQPTSVARQRYKEVASVVNPDGVEEIENQWIEDNSFNTVSYQEIFTLPSMGTDGENYYAIQFGDVYLIGLYATRVWRPSEPEPPTPSKYLESEASLDNPDEWGYGEFIFEDLQKGSEQYEWLAEQLKSQEFRNSKYKIVMMHQAPHGFGKNHIPVFAHPLQIIDRDDRGRITSVRYEYPIDRDILFNDVMPLLKEAGVDLIHSGHSHLWFRINIDGITYVETSHVGNSYGCYIDGYKERTNTPGDDRFDARNYPKTGDPHGLSPAMPTNFSPLTAKDGTPLPCVDRSDLTIFTILDTQKGTLSSYVYDTRQPDSPPRLFDEVLIGQK